MGCFKLIRELVFHLQLPETRMAQGFAGIREVISGIVKSYLMFDDKKGAARKAAPHCADYSASFSES